MMPPPTPASRLQRLLALFAGLLFVAGASAATRSELDRALAMSLQDLLSLEATSASKKTESVRDSAAAIYVVTAEDIRRLGATSIPEALRLVPGVNVARINSNQWAVGIRGFMGRFTDKLLVLLDGRTVYRPSFSGTYWEELDTYLPDVERIEVIRGPGAALWGSNAVNGVINIITRHPADTHGLSVTAGAGTDTAALLGTRFGMPLDESIDARLFVNHRRQNAVTLLGLGDSAEDEADITSAGMRVDGRTRQGTAWTLQGDVHRFEADYIDQLSLPPSRQTTEADGWSVLGRLGGETGSGGEWQVQAYYQQMTRDDPFLGQHEETLDLEFQHRFDLTDTQELFWGGGYRLIRDDYANTALVSMSPKDNEGEILNIFVQDEITFVPNALKVIVGARLEEHYATGTTLQPTGRIWWSPATGHALWGSVSRAVRTPSRYERGISLSNLQLLNTVNGNPDQDNETLKAIEAGYRFSTTDRFSVDIAVFRNDYDDLQSTELLDPLNPLNPGCLPLPDTCFRNYREGDSTGIEVSVDWSPADEWRLRLGYAYLDIDAAYVAPSFVAGAGLDQVYTNGSPRHTVSLRAGYDISTNWDWDVWAIYTDEITQPGSVQSPIVPVVDAGVNLGTRLAWRPKRGLELSVTALNLLQPQQLEYVGEFLTPYSEIPRSVFFQVSWDSD
ncbi:MAG: TonB-dependent receptor [Gammaproteobacteria bacterium]|nr:TonB-dependent receptor [Gammaproteobacteria bacterium]